MYRTGPSLPATGLRSALSEVGLFLVQNLDHNITITRIFVGIQSKHDATSRWPDLWSGNPSFRYTMNWQWTHRSVCSPATRVVTCCILELNECKFFISKVIWWETRGNWSTNIFYICCWFYIGRTTSWCGDPSTRVKNLLLRFILLIFIRKFITT